jgi:tripartite-type tricarboxylate transporter receptor subunit TctC
MNPVRRQFLSLASAGFSSVLAAACVSPAYAQTDFPSRRIHIVLPYPAGGTVDGRDAYRH